MPSPVSVKTFLPILTVLASCGSGDKRPLDTIPSVGSGTLYRISGKIQTPRAMGTL